MPRLVLALLAALLFGAFTPASRVLLADLSPLQLAGFLYLGAAVGTAPLAWRDRRKKRGERRADARSVRRLAGALLFGGIVGPVLLLIALQSSTSSSVSLLLNLEMIATALLGRFAFREHVGFAGWIGIESGLAAGVVLSIGGGSTGIWSGICVAGACAAWGLDNHLTALIDGMTPAEATTWKGLVAGGTNLELGLALEPLRCGPLEVILAIGLGVFAYGASIVLYVLAARQLGATRAQVAFSSSPFLGAGLSFVFLAEPLLWPHAGLRVTTNETLRSDVRQRRCA